MNEVARQSLKLPVWDLSIVLALSDKWGETINGKWNTGQRNKFFMQDANFGFEHIKI